MLALTAHRFRNGLRRLMLCSLLIAIPVYGTAATVVDLLGVRHIHALATAGSAGADPMAGWSDLRRGGFQPVPQRRGHHHTASERHHHAPADASVVVLDVGPQAGDTDSGSIPTGSLVHVFALSSVGFLTVQPRGAPTWLDAARAAASPWVAHGPERPPKP